MVDCRGSTDKVLHRGLQSITVGLAKQSSGDRPAVLPTGEFQGSMQT